MTEYDTEDEAHDGADYVMQRYGNEMSPYECSQCSYWHLAPYSNNTHSGGYDYPRESQRCYGKISGKVLLKEYDSEQAAMDGAAYVQEKYGKQMVPYDCEDCYYWHLSPVERQTEVSSSSCGCVDEHGSSKDGYQSQEAAERRADIILNETSQTRDLNVYRCPVSHGTWHLTKRNANDYVGRKSTQCRNKQGNFRMEYENEENAEIHGAEMLEKYGRVVSPYGCSDCGMWHVG